MGWDGKVPIRNVRPTSVAMLLFPLNSTVILDPLLVAHTSKVQGLLPHHMCTSRVMSSYGHASSLKSSPHLLCHFSKPQGLSKRF